MNRRGTILLLTVLIVVLAALQWRLWHGPGSIPAAAALRVQIEAQKKENVLLEQRNDQAYAEILELKSGLETVEERARKELVMIKPGETLFMIPNMTDATTANP